MVIIHNVWLWFPKRPGLVTGIAICGYGCGALILDPITTHLVNPDNLPAVDMKYPDSVNDNFSYMLQVLIIIFVVLTIISLLTIHGGP
jgi:uncharacterized Tic20 family protein